MALRAATKVCYGKFWFRHLVDPVAVHFFKDVWKLKYQTFEIKLENIKYIIYKKRYSYGKQLRIKRKVEIKIVRF